MLAYRELDEKLGLILMAGELMAHTQCNVEGDHARTEANHIDMGNTGRGRLLHPLLT